MATQIRSKGKATQIAEKVLNKKFPKAKRGKKRPCNK